MKLPSQLRIFPVLALFALASCGSGGPTGPTFDFDDKVIVAFGNSITVGVGDTSYPSSAAGYPFRLEQLLKASSPDAIVLNRGNTGEGTNEGEARLRTVLEKDQPDYVLILEGVNDVQRGGSAEAAFIVGNLEGMVKQVKRFGAVPLVASLLPTKGRWDWRNDAIASINPLIEDMAARQDVTFVDLHDAFIGEPDYEALLSADDLHPNGERYRVMAQAWYEGMIAAF